jgi:chromosome segregation ATPase
MSTIYETIYTLEEFNKWRRGNKRTTAPDPFEVGVAIGDAVRLLRELFVMQVRAEKAESELAAAKKRIADCEFVMAHRYDIIERQEPRCNEANARAEKAEAQLHDLNLDLSTANHMIKLERDRADTLQTRLNEIDAMLNSPETF